MLKVLLVDDQVLVRKGLQRILNQEHDITVVAECDDGDQVVETVNTIEPDVVLMDIRMKRVDGISATKLLQDNRLTPPVMMLTTFAEDELLWNALAAGASGYVLKDASTDDLVRATRAIARGGAWLDPTITDTVIEHYRLSRSQSQQKTNTELLETLTKRESEVLLLIAEGLTNTEIADTLCVSEATVKTHVSHIFSKLNARDRAAAIVYAYDSGLVQPGRSPQ